MKSTLLATKLYQPALAPRRVVRTRLIERLDAGLARGHTLTLVSAPAGFGKSTCVSEWLNTRGQAAAWLSLDPGDDSPERFFSYLAAALQSVAPNLGRAIAGLLQSGPGLPPEALAATLIDHLLGLQRDLVLVLDDFQVIQDGAILAVIERLVTNPPPRLHLVLVTREDPPLPLARLRAHDRLTEIRSADLRFTAPEVDRFLNEVMDLALRQPDLTALEDRTEGWVVGLQLAGLSIRGQADPTHWIAGLKGSHRHILGYLVSEVLERQPADIQQFLLQTAILAKLSGPLCDAVTGRSDSAALLERLFNANLFLIPLDDELTWYRYHHLFADLLRSQQNRLPRGEVAQLHRRASAGYEQAGLPGEAIEHALAGGDYPQAVILLERYARGMIMHGYARTVQNWIQAVPPEWHARSVQSNLAFAWVHILRGSYAQTEPYLKLIEAALAAPEADSAVSDALRAEWYALQANLLNVQGHPTESIAMARRALELADPADTFVRGSAYLGMGGAYRLLGDYPNLSAAYQQAIQISRAGGHLLPEVLGVTALTLVAIQHGRLHFAVELGSPLIERMEHSGAALPPILGTVIGSLGTAYYEWNQLERARDCFARAGQLSALSGHNAGVIYNQLLMARFLQSTGQVEEAAQALREVSELLPQGVPAWILPEIAAQRVRVYLALGQPELAAAVLQPYHLDLDAPLALPEALSYSAELIYLAALRLLCQRARPADALPLADRLVTSASAAGRVGLALQALLLRAQLRPASAQADLARALELAEPEGYIRLFVDEGPQLAPLLQAALAEARRHNPARAGYLQSVLDAFGNGPASSSAHPALLAPREGEKPDVDALSEREWEVLNLMAEGLRYEEIAQRLVITLNTVRFHVKSIYARLHVNNRTRAIEAARGKNMPIPPASFPEGRGRKT